jgi:hypothetical protein
VATTLLVVILKNRKVTGIKLLLVGIMVVAFSKISLLFSSQSYTLPFYISLGVGYFLIACSIILLGNYLKSIRLLEHTAL